MIVKQLGQLIRTTSQYGGAAAIIGMNPNNLLLWIPTQFTTVVRSSTYKRHISIQKSVLLKAIPAHQILDLEQVCFGSVPSIPGKWGQVSDNCVESWDLVWLLFDSDSSATSSGFAQ